MRSRYVLAVALVASVVLCIRNASTALAFSWALAHAGPSAVLTLRPIAIPLALLWGGFWYLRRSHPRAPVLFVAFAVAIVILNEAPLPGTNAERKRDERAIQAVEVRNLHDEVLLSAKGNPIGIRLTYEVVVPARVVAFPYLHLMWGEAVTPIFDSMQFWGPADTIEPVPETVHTIYRIFERDRLYRLTAKRMPGFLVYDEDTQQPCLRLRANISEADIAAAIDAKGPATYAMTISLSTDGPSGSAFLAAYRTSREYDLEAMYQTIVREGYRRCSF